MVVSKLVELLNVTPAKWGGAENNAKEGKEVKQSLTKVPRSMANLEAEGGETAFGPISGDTIPDHMTISRPQTFIMAGFL